MRSFVFIFTLTVSLVGLGSAQQTAATPIAKSPGPIIGGDGTANYLAIWHTPNYLQSSVLYQTGGSIGIGTISPAATLDVNGSVNAATTYSIGTNIVLSIGGDPFYGNLFLGPAAGSNDDTEQGFWNTFLGKAAGQFTTTGTANSFTGYMSGVLNVTGSANTFNGSFTGTANTTGSSNTFIGSSAGNDVTYGSNNTFTGQQAGFKTTSGYNNLFYGYTAGYYNTTGSSDIYIGNTGPQSGTESNAIRIGIQGTQLGQQNMTYVAGIYGSSSASGIPVYINANGQLGTQTSSLRFKEQVRDMGESTDALMKLRPVTFLYKQDYSNGERTLQYGLVAEEVAKVYPELVAYDADGLPYSVRYQYLSTMLLNELQKEHRKVEDLQAELQVRNAELEKQNEDLQLRLARVETLLQSQANSRMTETAAIAH